MRFIISEEETEQAAVSAMKKKYEFSKAVQGKFYCKPENMKIPVSIGSTLETLVNVGMKSSDRTKQFFGLFGKDGRNEQ